MFIIETVYSSGKMCAKIEQILTKTKKINKVH